jgi:hypothetical protein
VKQLLVTLTLFGENVLEEGFAVFSDEPSRRRLVVKVQDFSVDKVLGLAGHSVGNPSQDALHHRQMLSVVVSLKESDSQVQLEEDASNGPDVARIGPTEFQDDFWSSIVSRGDDGRVMLLFEGC